jgi:hypothetical protein
MSATMHISGIEQIMADRGGTKEGLLLLRDNALLQKVVAWYGFQGNLFQAV